MRKIVAQSGNTVWNIKEVFLPALPFSGKAPLPLRGLSVISCSFIAFTLVLWFRSWPTIAVPSLFVEDASHYFNNFYGGRHDLDIVLFKPHGYYNIVNNFVAWAGGFTDVRIQPALYVAFALLVSYGAVFLASFSGLVRNRLLLFTLPFVLGLSGLNHIFYYVTLTYQMYVLIVVLLLLLFLPAPKNRAVLSLQCALSVLLVFSGPYSVVSIPVCIMFLVLFNDSRKRILWAVTLAAALFYLSVSGGSAKIDNLFNGRIVYDMFQTMITDVCFLGLLHASVAKLLSVVVLFLVTAFYLLRKDRSFLYVSVCLLAVSGCSLIPFFLSVKIVLYREPYPCHLLLSQFFWILFVFYLADRFFMKYRPAHLIQYSVVILFFSLIVYDNSVNRHKMNVQTNDNIALFTKKIRYAESLNLNGRNQYVLISSPGARQIAFQPMVRVGSLHPSAAEVEIDYSNAHIH